METEIAIAALAGTGFLALLSGVALGRASKREAPFVPFATYSGLVNTATAEAAHVHQRKTCTPTGWYCECGLHQHVFLLPVRNENGSLRVEKRCQCGEVGTVDTWLSQ